MNLTTWMQTSPTYRRYQQATARCIAAFAPKATARAQTDRRGSYGIATAARSQLAGIQWPQGMTIHVGSSDYDIRITVEIPPTLEWITDVVPHRYAHPAPYKGAQAGDPRCFQFAPTEKTRRMAAAAADMTDAMMTAAERARYTTTISYMSGLNHSR